MIRSIKSSAQGMLHFKFLAIISLLGTASVAFGGTINPANYASGTDISTATSGVVLSAPGNASSTEVYAAPFFTTDVNGSFIGNNSYTYNNVTYYGSSWSQSQPLKATFTSPVSLITLNFLFGGFQGDSGYAEVQSFNSLGVMIAQTNSAVDATSLSLSGTGVSYIEEFTANTSQYDVAGVTSLSFTPAGSSVPEGGDTFISFGMVLTGLGLFAWRRQRLNAGMA